jgi:hypothetical protein
MVRRSVWKKTVGAPKGKRGAGVVPVIPWLGQILDAYLLTYGPQKYLFEGLRGCPTDLDYIVQSVILPSFPGQAMSWLARVPPRTCH